MRLLAVHCGRVELINFSYYSLSLMPFVWALRFSFAVVSCWTANVILAEGDYGCVPPTVIMTDGFSD